MACVEKQAARRFGDAADPLLVSVRSGAPVSMPGMLDTILNLGLNDESTAGLATVSGDAAFAAACRQRLATMYRDIVGVTDVPSDPWLQLRTAVEAVFRSWDSDRARAYREKEGISADLGTAVVVQTMVFGNRGPRSATGVLFTRNPATGENVLYGDILFGAQGEDVVAGTHATEPVSVLEERMLDVAAQLRSYAERLEAHFRDVCDIEFTIEEGRLWMLQNRIGKRTAQAACRVAMEMAEDETFPLSRPEAVERVAAILGGAAHDRGRTIRGGRRSSPLAWAPHPVWPPGPSPRRRRRPWRWPPTDRAVLAGAGSQTSPDDVHGMARSVGILTSTGGLAPAMLPWWRVAGTSRRWSGPAMSAR